MGSLFLQFESRKNFTTQPWPPRVEAVLRLPHYCYCCCLAHYIIDIIRNEDNVRRKLKRSLSLCPRRRAPLEELTDSVKRPRGEILRFVWVIRQGTGSANSKTEWLLLPCVKVIVRIHLTWVPFGSLDMRWFQSIQWNLVFLGSYDTVENSQFFCHLDFTWNQY